MKNRALPFLVAATFAATTACSLLSDDGFHPMAGSKKCGGVHGTCTITIHVDKCDPNGVASYDYDTLYVKVPDQDIVWNLDPSQDYEFRKDDGIWFKGTDWPKEFDLPSGNKKRFKWHDKNNLGTGVRTYTYGITILNADGSVCIHTDPIIVNDA